jgi:hypothetical protein
MSKADIFNAIVDAFNDAYGWLGKQFAEEFLYVAASQVMQRFLDIKRPRIRSHLLLMWDPGWYKSTLLGIASELLGEENCEYISDITPAVFRGTVVSANGTNEFVPPACKTKPFIIVTELGSLTAGSRSNMINQLFLITLEEGKVSVGLASLAKLSDEQKAQISAMYNIQFSNGRMTYTTTSTFLCATYDESYLTDYALVSRFEVMIPGKELGNELVESTDGREFIISDGVKERFREIINTAPPENLVEEWRRRIPKEVYSLGKIDPRIIRSVKSYRLARLFWEQDVDNNMLVERARYLLNTQAYIKMRLGV